MAECVAHSCAMSNTPHVTLTGFGYLEPLARPIKPPTVVAPPEVPEVPPLSPRIAKLTDRLAVRSQWLKRRGPSNLAHDTKLSPGGTDLFALSRVNTNSQYSTSGIWPSISPPRPTVARGALHASPRQPAIQRRVGSLTSDWHVPPQPGQAARAEDGEVPFAWRKRWDRVSNKDVTDGESSVDRLERVGSSL